MNALVRSRTPCILTLEEHGVPNSPAEALLAFVQQASGFQPLVTCTLDLDGSEAAQRHI
jgi:hypothetical protein